MFNRVRDFLEPSFPLSNHIRFDLSFFDKPRQLIVYEVREALALLVIRDSVPLSNPKRGVYQSNCKRCVSIGGNAGQGDNGRTYDVDILSHCLNLVGCAVEDDNSPFGTLCQDTHSEGMCLRKRDCVESNMDAIGGSFLQLPNHLRVLVLYKQQSATSEEWGREPSTNIEDNIRSEILDKPEVTGRRDSSHLVTREFRELDCILADRGRPSVYEEPVVGGAGFASRSGKTQGLRSVQSLNGSIQTKHKSVRNI